jgi:mxaJ protein
VIRTKLARFVFAAAFMAVALPAAAGAADLRVCADPDYMPFSDKAGEGFENKVAAYTAHALGEKLVYVWASTRGNGGFDQFVHENLDKKKCDVVMDVPYAADNILATEPYYISSYVFIYPKKKHYDISSMDSPALKGLRIGFEADTPAENGLKLRTLIIHATPFDSTDAPNSDTDEMLQALAAGKIAVGVTWEPAVGYYLRTLPQYAVVAVPNSRSQGSPEQYAFPMSMAARLGDSATRDKLNRVIAAHKAQLTAILAHNGVKLYQPADIASQ